MEETVTGEADGQKQEVIISKRFGIRHKRYEKLFEALESYKKVKNLGPKDQVFNDEINFNSKNILGISKRI